MNENQRQKGYTAAFLQTLQGKWPLLLAICILSLGIGLLLKQVNSYFDHDAIGEEPISQETTSKFESSSKVIYSQPISFARHTTPNPYIRVVHIARKIEGRRKKTNVRGLREDRYVNISVTVENISEKVITELQGSLEYLVVGGNPSADGKQLAIIQYVGEIPPGGKEEIRAYVHLPGGGSMSSVPIIANFEKIVVQ